MREYAELLRGLPFELTTLSEQGIKEEVEESGSSLEQNAVRKATAYVSLSGLTTLADDSGLEVDALGGEPGSLSHRYAGENATDADRINYLLSKLGNVPEKERTAQFRCVIAIAEPDGKVELCSGECRGIIIMEPKGSRGFGYDPIFFLPELGKTMAELSLKEKNRVSHRARAAEKARALLMKLAY